MMRDSFSRLAVFTSARLEHDDEITTTVAERIVDPRLPGRCWTSTQGAPDEWLLASTGGASSPDLPDRFVIDAERCRAVAEIDGKTLGHIPTCLTVDLTLSWPSDEPGRAPSLIVKVGAWTQWPTSPTLGPALEVDEPGLSSDPESIAAEAEVDGWPAGEVGLLLDGDFFAAAHALLGLVVGDRRVFEPLVLGRRYVPPRMYLACPSGDAPRSGDDWFSSDWLPVWSGITKAVLAVSDQRDARIAGSIQAGSGTLTLYRAIANQSASLPNVLFLPAGEYDAAAFEDEVVLLGRFLDRFELQVIYELAEGINELEMNVDRVRDYELVGQEASAIVNPLLLALATSSRDELQRVQSAVDLVRVTLLQSGPELISLHARISQRRAREENLRLTARNNRLDFGERAPDGMAHVDEALVASGSFEMLDRETRRAVEVLEGLTPIRSMIDNTASILADRREQAVARLTSTAHKLNLVLLVLAAATTIDLLVHFNWEQTYDWVNPALRTGVIVAMLCVVAWYTWVRARRQVARHIGGIDPWAVRDRIIAHLQRNALVDLVSSQTGDSWDEFDRSQARDLAEIVSQVEAIGATLAGRATELFATEPTPSATQLDYFIGRAEHWALTALLVAERPFPFARTMPRTASIFHLLSDGRFVSGAELQHVLSPTIGYDAVDPFRSEGLSRRRAGATVDELVAYVDEQLSQT